MSNDGTKSRRLLHQKKREKLLLTFNYKRNEREQRKSSKSG